MRILRWQLITEIQQHLLTAQLVQFSLPKSRLKSLRRKLRKYLEKRRWCTAAEIAFLRYRDLPPCTSQALAGCQKRTDYRRQPWKLRIAQKIVFFGSYKAENFPAFKLSFIKIQKQLCFQFNPSDIRGIKLLIIIFSINMFTNNQNSRMSRIADHNIYHNTDNLYEPLRNALRKSTVSSNFLSPQPHLADNRLSASRVAKNMRSLSPAETEIIKKSIFIPVNKELVPTRNLQKVMGKQFVTVDMQQKVGQAISPDEFSRVKTGTIEEIVYQIKQDEPLKSIYTYTTRNTAHQQTSPQMFHSRLQSQPQPYLNSPPPQVYNSPVQTTIKVQAPLPPQHRFVNQNARESIKLPSQPFQTPNFNNVLKTSSGLNQVSPKFFQSSALPTVTSQEFFKEPPTSTKSLLQNKQPTQRSKQIQTTVRAYDFRQSTASKQDSMLRLRKEREEYKYNLFSLIDEGGNNGCQNGCFGSNEICAPKISTNPWK